MNHGEQAQRLLSELERHDHEAPGTEALSIATSRLLAALFKTDFELPAAIVDVARDA
jgi:hypothetical protein